MLYLRYGNVEIKKQTQIFVIVSYYFRIMDKGDCINIGRKYKDAFNIKMIEYNKRGGNG